MAILDAYPVFSNLPRPNLEYGDEVEVCACKKKEKGRVKNAAKKSLTLMVV